VAFSEDAVRGKMLQLSHNQMRCDILNHKLLRKKFPSDFHQIKTPSLRNPLPPRCSF